MEWPKVLLWWLALQALGLLALPFTLRLFGRLPGRGYIFSKPLGLLLASYVLWLGASLRVLPNTRTGAWVAVLLLALVSAGAGYLLVRGEGRAPLAAWLRREWPVILTAELLLFLAFVGWAELRSFYPSLYTGEKRMEVTFINGILNSRWFPPQDPWLSGYSISYYYFGHVMIALLVRLTGIDLAYGFTLAGALWPAMTLAVSFGLVAELVHVGSGAAADRSRSILRRTIAFGLLGAAMVGLMGNLAGALEFIRQLRLAPEAWFRWLNLRAIMAAPAAGTWPPAGSWWLHASRVIQDSDPLGHTYDVFTDFPFFSFLSGDLHAQAYNLPFAPIAVALAACIFLGARAGASASRPNKAAGRALAWASGYFGFGPADIALTGIVVGGIAFVHSWDAAIYLPLVAGAALLGRALADRRLSKDAVLAGLFVAIAVAALGYAFYQPYYANLHAPVSGIAPNLFFPTRLSHYLVMFGVFVPPLLGYLLLLGRQAQRRASRPVAPVVARAALVTGLALPAFAVLIALNKLRLGIPLLAGFWIRSDTAALVAGWGPAETLASALKTRLASPWTWLALTGVLAWGLVVLLRRLRRSDDPERPDSGRASFDVFVLGLALLAVLVTLALEFVYVDEPLGTRTNSVFKFYYQAWVLFAVAAAYGLSRILTSGAPRLLRGATLASTAVVLAAGLFYTVAALPAQAGYFRGPQTLNSLAYLERDMPDDLSAVRWLRANVPPDATILEAPAADYRVGHDSLVSTLTGNPTLAGWWDHEIHWHGASSLEMITERTAAASQIYLSPDPDTLLRLLKQWQVDYLYVGNLERARYKLDDPNIAVYDRALRAVFTQGGVRVYAVP